MVNVPINSYVRSVKRTLFPQRFGELVRGSFFTEALGVEKNYRLYLPKGYGTSDRRYPVIYMIHGFGASEDSWTSPTLDLHGTADAIDLQAIVVMPDGDLSLYVNSMRKVNADAAADDLPPGGKPRVRSPRYEDYMINDLIPYIDSEYRTMARREGRAIGGESSGGTAAMQLAIRHQNLFCSVASHSGGLALLYEGPHPYVRGQVEFMTAIVPDPRRKHLQKIFGTDITNWRAYDPYSLATRCIESNLGIYFDCGSEDEYGFNDQALLFHDYLDELKIEHRFEITQGKHHENLWKKQIRHSLNFHVEQFKKNGTYTFC